MVQHCHLVHTLSKAISEVGGRIGFELILLFKFRHCILKRVIYVFMWYMNLVNCRSLTKSKCNNAIYKSRLQEVKHRSNFEFLVLCTTPPPPLPAFRLCYMDGYRLFDQGWNGYVDMACSHNASDLLNTLVLFDMNIYHRLNSGNTCQKWAKTHPYAFGKLLIYIYMCIYIWKESMWYSG